MTKNLALAASIMVLVATLGTGICAATRPTPGKRRYQAQILRPNMSAFGAFDQMTTPTQPVALNTHRYDGGPKSND